MENLLAFFSTFSVMESMWSFYEHLVESWEGMRSFPSPKLTVREVNVILTLSSLFVYSNCIFGEYVHDDLPTIVHNPDVQGKTSLQDVFLNDFWGMRMSDAASHKSYRPLIILTFRLEKWVVGFSCAFVSHMINVLLHVCVTLLYAHVLHTCLKLRIRQVLFSALLFAVHPIHTEAVSGVVGRADILSGMAFLLCFYFYCRLLEAMSKVSLILWSLGLCTLITLGILCKETAITGVFLCIVWEIILCKKHYERWKKIDYDYFVSVANRAGRLILMAFVLLFLRLCLMRTSPVFSKQDNPVSFEDSFKTRIMSYIYLPAFNMWLLLYPWKLAHDWQLGSIPPINDFNEPRNLASLAFLLSLLIIVIVFLRAKSRQSGAILWSVAVMTCSFLPASNLFFRVGFVVAERILYTPSFGFCLILGIGSLKLAESLNKVTEKLHLKESLGSKIGLSAFTLIVILLATKTLKRNMDWLSKESLLKSGLKSVPQNAKMHYNFANLWKDRSCPHVAIQYYIEAIRLWPDYPSAHNNLGTVYLQTGHLLEAENHFVYALKYHPGHIHAAENLASFLRHRNRTTESISILRKVLFSKHQYQHISSDVIRLGLLLADIYSDNGIVDLEEEIYIKLTAEYSMEADIHASYGNFLVKQKKYDKAVRHFEAALSLDPHSQALPSYVSLIDSHFHHNETFALYKRSLEKMWNSDIATSLAKSYLKKGQLDDAEQILLKVLDLDPHHVGASVYLAQVRLQQKQYLISETLLIGALKLYPNNRQALYHLSVLLATTNRSYESIRTAKNAASGCFQPTPFCATLHTHLADLMHTNAMVEPAIQNYQIALNLHPSLVQALLNLGAIYHLQGNYSDAWEYYNKALELEPSNVVIQENILKLRRIYQGSSETLLNL